MIGRIVIGMEGQEFEILALAADRCTHFTGDARRIQTRTVLVKPAFDQLSLVCDLSGPIHT